WPRNARSCRRPSARRPRRWMRRGAALWPRPTSADRAAGEQFQTSASSGTLCPMKFRLRILTALSLVMAACSAPVIAGDERIHVVLLHTNDLHGQVLPRKATWLKKEPVPLVGGITRVAAYVDRAKSEAQKNGEIVFVVDAGDWFQGTPEGLIDDGQGFVNALAFTGYDALCIGNH